MKKKNKKKEKKILIIILIIIIVFLLLYFFINDKEKNNFLFNSLKDLTADISKVTVINNKDDLNKEITKEINKDYQNEKIIMGGKNESRSTKAEKNKKM